MLRIRIFLSFARVNGYAVLTQDLDFNAILAVTQGLKPSVVQIRHHDVSPGTLGKLVVEALRKTEADLAQGALLTIDANHIRLRILPLR
jgi:predicted nuclease of predicted toxin-antitoxin system